MSIRSHWWQASSLNLSDTLEGNWVRLHSLPLQAQISFYSAVSVMYSIAARSKLFVDPTATIAGDQLFCHEQGLAEANIKQFMVQKGLL